MSSYIITNPSDIFTLIMNVYGTLEESIPFLSGNAALIPSLSADISMLAGEEVYYDAALVVTGLSPNPLLVASATPAIEYTWPGREGQNMFDVCVQTYGVLDNMLKLLTDNNLEWGSPVYEQPFLYDSTLIANSSVWSRSTGMGIVFSTGAPPLGGSFNTDFEYSSYEKTTVY